MTINSIILNTIADMIEIRSENEAKLDKITAKYLESRNYPRKRKKQVRKRLLLDYSILSYANNHLFPSFGIN